MSNNLASLSNLLDTAFKYPPLPPLDFTIPPKPKNLPPPPPAVTKTTSAANSVFKNQTGKVTAKMIVRPPAILNKCQIVPEATIRTQSLSDSKKKFEQDPSAKNCFDFVDTALTFECNYDDALRMLGELSYRGCRYPLISYYRGLIYQKRNEFDSARFEFEVCVGRSPTHIGAWEKLIEIYTETMTYEEIEDYLEEKIESVPNDNFSRIALAVFHISCDRYNNNYIQSVLAPVNNCDDRSYRFIARYCLSHLTHEIDAFSSHPDFIQLLKELEAVELPQDVHKDSMISRILKQLYDDTEEFALLCYDSDDEETLETVVECVTYQDAYLERHPEDTEMRASKSKLLSKSERLEEFLANAKQGVRVNLRDFQCWFDLALAQSLLKKFEEAIKSNIKCYNLLFGLENRNYEKSECLILFGSIYEKLGFFHEAIWFFTEADKLYKDLSNNRMIAQCVFQDIETPHGNSLGIQLLKHVLKENPYDYKSLELLFKFYVRQGGQESLQSLNIFLKSYYSDDCDTSDPKAQAFLELVMYYIALFHQKYSSPQVAVNAYLDLLNLFPIQKESLHNTISLCEEYAGKVKNAYEIASEKVQVLIKAYPEKYETIIQCASFYNNHGFGALAQSCLNTLSRSDTKDVNYLFEKARAFYNLSLYEHAIELSLGLINHLSQDRLGLIYEILGNSYYIQDSFADALKYYNKIFEISKNKVLNTAVLLNRSIAYRSLGQYAEAEKDLKEVRKLDPKNLRCLRSYLHLYVLIDKPAGEFLALLNDFHSIAPMEWKYVSYLTDKLIQKGFINNAILKLEEFEKLTPASPGDLQNLKTKLKELKKQLDSEQTQEAQRKAKEEKEKERIELERRADVAQWRENLYAKPVKLKKEKSEKPSFVVTENQKEGIRKLLQVLGSINKKDPQVHITWSNSLNKFYFELKEDIEFPEKIVDQLTQSTEKKYLTENLDKIYKSLEKLTI